MHTNPSPYAGKKVTLSSEIPDDPDRLASGEAVVEDWWDRVSGGSWMMAQGNPAALKYAIRSALAGLSTDDEVLYVKVDGLGHLVHISEVAAAEAAA